MKRSVLMATLALGLGILAPVAASAQEGLSMMKGRWATPDQEEVVIERGPFGYQTWLSWIGQAQITPSGGINGSQIKIESADTGRSEGIICYYTINFQNLEPGFRQMGWKRVPGSTPGCPKTGVYRGILSPR